MNQPRAALPLILAAATFAAFAPNVAIAEDAQGVAIKIQIGGHLLTQGTGIDPPSVPGSTEDSGGVLATFTILGKDRGRLPYGFCFEIDGNGVDVGPEVEGVGIQTFGIATIRIMGLMEVRLRGPQSDPGESWQPYLSVGAGWNFHGVGTEITWLGSSPPPGTARSLDLDGSPVIRLGTGFHAKATEGGLSINMEGGWKWDAGDFRMRIEGQPDLRADYDLSGAFLLFGITLRF
jgi:hypothetical protein